MSAKCSIVENDVDDADVDGALRALSDTPAIFSGACTLFDSSRFGLSMRMPVSFTFFLQDNKHTELMLVFFFNKIRTKLNDRMSYILQHSYDFQSNVAIFPSVVEAYTQPYSFSGGIKLTICQIRHDLSVTIYEISTKNVRWLLNSSSIIFKHLKFCIKLLLNSTINILTEFF